MNARILICTLFLLATACSTQWRTSDPQVNQTDLMQWLSDAQSASATNASATGSEISTSDQSVTIFFADAPGPMGTVASVLAFQDISFLGPDAPALASVVATRVFFLDQINGPNGRQDELIVGVSTDGSTYQYFKFYGSGSVDSGTFSVSFDDGNGGSFTLASDDVGDNDTLNGTIQLRALVAAADGSGDVEIGKFSVLAGFQ
jgi:hypothetical protein